MGCSWKPAGVADDVRGGAGPLVMHLLMSPTAQVLARSLCGHCPHGNFRIGCLKSVYTYKRIGGR
jgi:hypothetical protein